MGGFGWYWDKNHKNYHLNMIFTYFTLGGLFLFLVYYYISSSVLIAILFFFLSSLTFVYGVYHIKEQIKKNRLKKENKNNTKNN